MIPVQCVFAEDVGPTARGLFMLLPSSIFEESPEGLTESAKEDLLNDGKSDYWEITEEDPDTLVFNALPFNERSISLRLFRDYENGKVLAIFGTAGETPCALELWQVDMTGRAVPAEAPHEPQLREFYKKKAKIQAKDHYSIFLCLKGDKLEAAPYIYRGGELRPALVDNKITYAWDGKTFEKKIERLKKNPKESG